MERASAATRDRLDDGRDDPFLLRQGDALRHLERILPFAVRSSPEGPRGTIRPEPPTNDIPARDWTDALDLVREAAETVRTTAAHAAQVEARTEHIIARAYEELAGIKSRVNAAEAYAADAEAKQKAAEIRATAAESHLKAAEARAEQAEQRAKQAEQWLQSLYDAVVEGFSGTSALRPRPSIEAA